MSRTNHGGPSPSRQRSTGSRATVAVAASSAAVLAIAIALVVMGGDTPRDPSPPADRAGTTVEYTGERNDMGLPVIVTPGTLDGTAATASVSVDGATWSLGHVPLNVAVRPTWTLRNIGTAPVTIGQPHAEVLAGCCPGALTVDTERLAPGQDATLSFELAMHPGMDGWHEMAVHVPVGSETLTLSVNGDFR
jgi:hypothetical protein